MCHEPDARAPLPPISGASDLARSADIVLRSSDGTDFAAFEALTSHDGAPGIVILPDVRGLHPFYRDLAMRSAEAGMHAVAIDYFGRTGVIGFYGLPQRRDEVDVDPPVELAGEYRCKVLGLFGGADQAISADAVDAFRTALNAAQVPNELVTYEGAPHSFFDKRYEEHRDACADTWRRILGFVGINENA